MPSLLYVCIRTWFEHHSPTMLRIDGHKIKYQFSLHGEMLYTGLDAWVHGWNERERGMRWYTCQTGWVWPHQMLW